MNETDPQLQERLHTITTLTCSLIELPSREDSNAVRHSALRMVQHHIEDAGDLEVRHYEKDGVPSMVVTPTGNPEPTIMLLAHADVVEHSDPAAYRAERIDGRIVGPGAGDMKGQLAILAELFRAMHTRHDKPSLGLCITTDEETGGDAGVGYLFTEDIVRCGLILNPDGGSLNEVTVQEKGVMHLRLQAHGTSCHAARPWRGDNALTKLRQQLAKLEDSFTVWQTDPDHWHPTCSVTAIQTDNCSINRIPSRASATVDVRFPPPFKLEDILQHVRDMLGPEITIATAMTGQPVELKPDPLFLTCCEAVCKAPPTIVRDSGASDSRYIAAKGIPVITSRPLVGKLHARDEWIDVESMATFYQICELYVERKLGLQ